MFIEDYSGHCACSSKICSPVKDKFKHHAMHDFVILAEVNHTLKVPFYIPRHICEIALKWNSDKIGHIWVWHCTYYWTITDYNCHSQILPVSSSSSAKSFGNDFLSFTATYLRLGSKQLLASFLMLLIPFVKSSLIFFILLLRLILF